MNKEIVEQQDNVVTTKDKYNRVIKRSIILCWIALAICFIVKIFGGNFFEIVIPLLICRNIWRVLIGVALTLIFQVLSLITKNIGLGILGDNFLVSIIVMIDTYFMLALYYLYSLKLEVKKNG